MITPSHTIQAGVSAGDCGLSIHLFLYLLLIIKALFFSFGLFVFHLVLFWRGRRVQVVMTDYLESILQNLQANVDMWRGGPEAQAGDGQEVNTERDTHTLGARRRFSCVGCIFAPARSPQVSAKCLDWNREPGIDHELMRQAKQRERDNHPDEDEDEDEENHRKEVAPRSNKPL